MANKRIIYPALGSILLEEQIRKLGPKIHIYGHSHVNNYTIKDDILYINNALTNGSSLMLIINIHMIMEHKIQQCKYTENLGYSELTKGDTEHSTKWLLRNAANKCQEISGNAPALRRQGCR